MLGRKLQQAIRRTAATTATTSSRNVIVQRSAFIAPSYRTASTTSDQNKKQIPIPEQPDTSPDKNATPLDGSTGTETHRPATVSQTEDNKNAQDNVAEDAHTLMSEQEKEILNKLLDNYPGGAVAVQDVSGGCGTFFAIQIESDKFKGMSTIKQHQHVNKILKDEVATWHGMQLKTMTP